MCWFLDVDCASFLLLLNWYENVLWFVCVCVYLPCCSYVCPVFSFSWCIFFAIITSSFSPFQVSALGKMYFFVSNKFLFAIFLVCLKYLAFIIFFIISSFLSVSSKLFINLYILISFILLFLLLMFFVAFLFIFRYMLSLQNLYAYVCMYVCVYFLFFSAMAYIFLIQFALLPFLIFQSLIHRHILWTFFF